MDYLDLELKLTEDDLAVKRAAQKFVEKIMRPIARELDTMTAEQVIAKGSPLWDFLKEAFEQGYHCSGMPVEVGGAGLTPLQSYIVNEELGWGSFGLAVQLGVIGMPFALIMGKALLTGETELVDKFLKPFCQCKDASMRGCWAITEVEHGSDLIGSEKEIFSDPNIRWSVQAKQEGEEWVLNGQKSAWVSGATIANYALLFAGVDSSKGMQGGGIFFCPLEIEGVTKGKPLEKMGQRDLNQGEIYFDNARIPKNYLLFGPDLYMLLHESVLAAANAGMGTTATGLARAAFEEALNYAKTRIQGGKPIIEHNSVRQRLAQMFAKVEACRALSRAVRLYNATPPNGVRLLEYSVASKITCTQYAFEIANEAIQLFGGNGMCREYLPEKLFRDARATLIEDGNNEILAMAAGRLLGEHYPRSR